MLDEATRTAILKLHEQGHGSRAIARALKISRCAVRNVIKSGQAQPPPLERAELAEPYREQILELIARFGHLGRVHEQLRKCDATLSYQALTAFCRKHGLSGEPAPPAGHYEHPMGQEMQHDTSPHWARIAGHLTRVQTASLVLCYSRMIFFQHYPRFTRFECKSFLTQAITYFGCAATICMIDNTHVVVASGSGENMIAAAEMAAFAQRFGFTFKAHRIGHANRSARVEAPFHRIEEAFLHGSDFASWQDLNAQALETCQKWNAAFSNKLHASRRELFAAEQPYLQKLPLHIPEVYQLHIRIVDAEGYVHINRIRYSAPYALIGRQLEVREMIDRVELYDGPRRIASHARVIGPLDTRVTDPVHRPPRGEGAKAKPAVPPEQVEMLQTEPLLLYYLPAFQRHHGGRRAALRRLLAMLQEYPRAAFLAALAQAEHYGLYDLDRLEKMILRQIAEDYLPFRSPAGSQR